MKNIYVKIFLLFLFSIFVNTGFSQVTNNNKRLKITVDGNLLMGDLGGGTAEAVHFFGIRDMNIQALRPGLGIGYKYKFIGKKYAFLEYFALDFNLNWKNVYANDKFSGDLNRKNRNLHVITNLFSGSMYLNIYFIKEKPATRFSFGSHSFFRNFSSYFIGGTGVFYFEPTANNNLAQIVKLRSLNTEGQGQPAYINSDNETITPDVPYRPVAYYFPVGAGFRYTFSFNFAMSFEFLNFYTSTDYLDDVSTYFYDWSVNGGTQQQTEMADRYIDNADITQGVQRGNSKYKDAIFSAIINLEITL